MRFGKRLWSVAALLIVLALPGTARGDTFVFSNPTPIAGPDGNALLPYPSTIAVSGLAGSIDTATVTLSGISHEVPDDLDVLLVGPSGGTVMVLSDACGGSPGVSGITLTLDDAAATAPPNGPPDCMPGTFKPANYAAPGEVPENLPSPAPSSPYGTLLGGFNGDTPNGTWSLYAKDDDANGASGAGITGGWSLTLSGPVLPSGPAPPAGSSPSNASGPAPTCGGLPATLVGTDGRDTLTGTPAADVIAGLAGGDLIKGLAGNDILCGGAGRDLLIGGRGRDRLLGESGKDDLRGGKDSDALQGGPGKDREVQ